MYKFIKRFSFNPETTHKIYSLISQIDVCLKIGGERGIRTLGTLSDTPLFESGTFNQLRHLSILIRYNIQKYNKPKYYC